MDRIGKDPHGRFLVSAAVLAEMLGVHTRSLTNYVRDRGMPDRVARGLWDLGSVVRWLNECAQANHTPASQAEAEARLKEIKAKREELAYRRDLGEVIEKGPALRVVEREIVSARNILERMVRRMLARVADDYREDLRQVVEGEVASTLAELAQARREIEDL